MEYNCFKRSLCNFQKGMITETLNLGLFTKSLLSSRIPYEEKKRKNVMFSFGSLAQIPLHGQKVTRVPPKNIMLILWITVKQCGQECERGKES